MFVFFVALCYSVAGMKANCKISISGFLKKLKVVLLVSYSMLQLIVLYSQQKHSNYSAIS